MTMAGIDLLGGEHDLAGGRVPGLQGQLHLAGTGHATSDVQAKAGVGNEEAGQQKGQEKGRARGPGGGVGGVHDCPELRLPPRQSGGQRRGQASPELKLVCKANSTNSE